MAEPRVVSLIASATEIVSALGMEHRLVGRSHECDFPPSILSLPICSSSKVDAAASSRDIDRQVREIVGEALSVYRVDGRLLDELAPTVIVTQTQCEVCAVSLRDVEEAVCEVVRSEPRIVPLAPMALGDVFDDIEVVAGALGIPDRGRELAAELKARLDVLRTRAAGLESRPRIACIEWIDPPMHAGNWVPELVEIAGGKVMAGEPGRHSGYFEFEELLSMDPDVIAVMPCGFDIARTGAEMPALAAQPGWNDLSAVRGGRVFLTDGNQYFNRPGPRVVESAEILAELLHPDEFGFGHRDSGWTPWVVNATG
ncbi:MAG: cobalamin-binding protein [Acidobacteria bacterium]|nr:cobalamin-binding protein [Acidobacteriota bacterium]MYA47568.1 cobalamin-binding protein [Acidobacteriota bacterium]MYI39762.1 cobalamin-binding protein [Acidobacteriota bacterium]